MRPRLIATALFLLSAAYACAQQSDGHLRLVFAGDLLGHIPLHKAAQQPDGSYDYEPCFRYVREYTSASKWPPTPIHLSLFTSFFFTTL